MKTGTNPKEEPMSIKSLVCVIGSLLLLVLVPTFAADNAPEVRLYALDCGQIDVKDMGMFSDTGEFAGQTGKLKDPCFLIRHPKGNLLWDLGLGDNVAQNKDGIDLPELGLATGKVHVEA
ncbi:MAG TPA: hypothetical protein VHM88_15010 [Candidatus Acidoferrales bacterium]|nr:hypothetical protein [Candidatus Acidoferrales bacterium]